MVLPHHQPNADRGGFLGARVAGLTLCAYLCAYLAVRSAGGPPASPPSEFAPGVRIDWAKRAVEVDGRVVLRKGSLELLACTPGTREHESILVVRGRPTHLYQAMGLVGLEPGSPVRYEEKKQRILAPTGQALEILVRYRSNGLERTVRPETWFLDVEKRKPPDSIRWVFAGSRLLADGRLGAEEDGTVVCVVDFDTALIAVGALHTADNEALWLAANTKEIPPVGTPCTLLIRGAPERTIEVSPPSATPAERTRTSAGSTPTGT